MAGAARRSLLPRAECPKEVGHQVVGIPAGVLLGRWTWRLVAQKVGSVSPSVVPVLAVLLVIAVVAMREVHANSQSIVPIATSAFGVVGSIIGAYFGVKVGSDGTQKAIAGMQGEAAKAQAFAAHLDPSKADAAIETAERLVGGHSHRPGQP